ncbi:hypothetical protein BD310DRAFT_990344 [Dichomitus squalens]|uniref:Adipose-regulatory protein-domain-containing protein n=1 Tax=Dichomitus squalens TaxID=114155 RepID=A0A4Q9Q4E0_9APHY|nr:hypothetical protein BD310DRAFT_990344 [Dichomitus squalens]
MDSQKQERDSREREQLRKQVADDTRGILSHLWPLQPVRLFIDLLWAVLRLFSPLAPHLVPLAVFSVILPLIILLSIASGFFVWKNIAVSWETDIYLQYGDGAIPHAEVALWNVAPNQPYDISLHLVVPANEANIALGNFMASLTLVGPSNSTIAEARKPAIVLPQYLAPWSFLYNRPGTVNLELPMLNDFVVGTSRATARVELGRRDQWRTLGEGHGRELAVLSGSVRGFVRKHGIRGLISRFPLLSALAASGVFFFILFIGLVACLMPAVEWHYPSEPDEPRQLEPEDKPRRRRRSRRPEYIERSESKSRPKTPTSARRTEGSGSRRQAVSAAIFLQLLLLTFMFCRAVTSRPRAKTTGAPQRTRRPQQPRGRLQPLSATQCPLSDGDYHDLLRATSLRHRSWFCALSIGTYSVITAHA